MKNFLEFLQEGIGSYSLREIIDNLTDEQILTAVEDYAYERAKKVLSDHADDTIVI